MKKIVFSLIILSLIKILNARTFEYSYQFADPEISNGKVKLEGCDLLNRPFQPKIALKQVKLLLNDGEEVSQVEIINLRGARTLNNVEIKPNFPELPLSKQPRRKMTFATPKIYQEDAFFPQNLISKKFKTAYKNGHPIALGLLYPMQYNPIKKELKYYRNIKLRISTKESKKQQIIKTNPLIKRSLRALVDNKEAVASLTSSRGKTNSSYDYLIITSNNFADSFTDFVNFNNQRCFKTKIATVETIEAEGNGYDLQDKIRNYIRDEYENNNISFVLLAGDVEQIPHRGFRSQILDYGTDFYDEKDIPADIYYSCLDGSWQLEGSEYYGECGSEDFLSEVLTARLPMDNLEDLENMTSKTIKFRTTPVTESLNNNMLVGEFLWSASGGFGWVDTYGKFYMDEFLEECDHNGYTTKGFTSSWDTHTLYQYDQSWDGYDLLDMINDKKIVWLDHLGHSNVDYNMHLYDQNVKPSAFDNDGTNANYFIIYSQGCYSGSFDNRTSFGVYGADCIGEKFVRIKNAAVAYIGNSRYGLGSPYDTDGSGQRFHRYFHDALFNQGFHKLQTMNSYSKEANAAIMLGEDPQINDSLESGPYFGQLHWIAYCVNLLGDPALAIWNAEPKNIDPASVPELLTNNKDFMMTTEPYAFVAILDENSEIKANGIADEAGYLQIPFADFKDIFTENTGTVKIRINAENHFLFEKEVNYDMTSIEENMPNKINLSIYPNPFNPATTISFKLNKAEIVTANLLNIKGEKVKSILSKNKMTAGEHKLKLDGNNLKSGTYFVKFNFGNEQLIKKITLIK